MYIVQPNSLFKIV